MAETEAQEELRRQLRDMDMVRLQRVGVYGSPQRFVLEHGQFYPPRPVPSGMWPGFPHKCFGNAIIVAVVYDVPYIEGYALVKVAEGLLALHHAWNLDAQGRVIDVTWHPSLALAYFGMAFSAERADDATWEGDASVLEDAKRHYPLLTRRWHGEPEGLVWAPSPRLDEWRARLGRRVLPAGGDPLEGDRQIQQCIVPTHQCFNDAMDILVDCLTTQQVPPEQLRLVHAICLLDDNTPFAHAWVERGTACLFLGLLEGDRCLCSVPRQEYYQRLRVQSRTKYTPWQAQCENERTTSYGPWKPAYLALCRKEDDG